MTFEIVRPEWVIFCWRNFLFSSTVSRSFSSFDKLRCEGAVVSEDFFSTTQVDDSEEVVVNFAISFFRSSIERYSEAVDVEKFPGGGALSVAASRRLLPGMLISVRLIESWSLFLNCFFSCSYKNFSSFSFSKTCNSISFCAHSQHIVVARLAYSQTGQRAVVVVEDALFIAPTCKVDEEC